MKEIWTGLPLAQQAFWSTKHSVCHMEAWERRDLAAILQSLLQSARTEDAAVEKIFQSIPESSPEFRIANEAHTAYMVSQIRRQEALTAIRELIERSVEESLRREVERAYERGRSPGPLTLSQFGRAKAEGLLRTNPFAPVLTQPIREEPPPGIPSDAIRVGEDLWVDKEGNEWSTGRRRRR